jgi:hypothetical protein
MNRTPRLLLLALSLVAISATLLATPAYGATAPSVRYAVVGLEGCSFFCSPATLDVMNPAAGTVTRLGDVGTFCPSASLASDLQHRVIYAALQFGGGRCGAPADSIVSISALGKTTHPVAQAPNGVVFDPATSSLFGTAGLSLVKISTIDWTEQSITLPDRLGPLALSPLTHTVYGTSADFSTSPVTGTIYSVDTETLAVTTGPALAEAVNALAYDPISNKLIGVGIDSPNDIYRIDPTTGTELPIASPTWVVEPPLGAVIEPTNHVVVFLESGPVFGGTASALDFVNAKNGAIAQSATFTTGIVSIALVAQLQRTG